MNLLQKKKLICFGLLILFLGAGVCFILMGNRRKGGNILAEASPDTSALQMYYFDGETVMVRTLYDSGREKQLLQIINGLGLKECDKEALGGLKPPFYGIWIGSTKGDDICLTWSEGIWLKNDGMVYSGEADFDSWWEEMAGEDEDRMTVLNFPNAGRLAEYHTFFMKKEETEAPDQVDGVSMAVERISAGEIEVTIRNDGEEEFVYGKYYSLQKNVDGCWYTMPVWEDNIGFEDIACILPPGESATETYNYNIFGPLSPGTYKLVVEQMGAEFAVID